MKLKVSQLVPNPFRNLKHYPIDKKKVGTLAQSIKDTSFWDNLLARPMPVEKGKGKKISEVKAKVVRLDRYEIAYGHHRLKALQQVMPNGTVDIPIRSLTDVEMIRIMANENGEDWAGSPQVDLETIKTVRQYLVDHEDLWKVIWLDTLDKTRVYRRDSDSTFEMVKNTEGNGPGALVIARFLGGGWTESRVSEVLYRMVRPIEKGEIDEIAMRTLKTPSTVQVFVRQMRNKPVASQRRVAKKIVAVPGGADRKDVERIAREELVTDLKERRKAELYEFVSAAYSALQRAHAQFITFLGELKQDEEGDVDLTALQMVSIQVYQVLGRWLNLPVEGPEAATEVGPLSAPDQSLATAKAHHEAAKTERRQKRTAAKSNIIDIPSTTLTRVK